MPLLLALLGLFAVSAAAKKGPADGIAAPAGPKLGRGPTSRGSGLSGDAGEYTHAEVTLQETLGPTVASYYGGGLAGIGASAEKKTEKRYLTPEEELAAGNPGVGLPLVIAKKLKWI